MNPQQQYPPVSDQPQYAPAPPVSSPPASTPRPSLNPLRHLIAGSLLLFKTNPGTALLLVILSIAVNIIVGVISVYALVLTFGLIFFRNSSAMLPFFILGNVAVMAISYGIFNGFVMQAINRVVIVGVQRHKVSFGMLLRFTWQRFGLTLRTFFTVFGIVLAGLALIAAAGYAAPILGGILGFAGFIALLIFGLRVTYASIVIMDDERPASVRAVYEKSSLLWKRSGGPVIVYFLTMVIIEFLVLKISPSTPFGSNLFSPARSANSLAAFVTVSALTSVLITSLVQMITFAGFGHLYLEARGKTSNETPEVTQPTVITPPAPSAYTN